MNLKKICIGLLILLLVALIAIPEVSATGTIRTAFLAKYSLPTTSPLNTCDTCHMPGDTSAWNDYGTDLQTQITGGATSTQGMTNIEPVDSDGDRFTNLQEITATPPTFPGDPASHPAPALVLTTITLAPATSTLNIAGTQLFTATARDQNGVGMSGIAITFTSSNASVGNVPPASVTTGIAGTATTTFTASSAGNAIVKAANGAINGTATVIVTAATTQPGDDEEDEEHHDEEHHDEDSHRKRSDSLSRHHD